MIFETLRIKNMMKNHHLAGAIADVGWGEFMRQCEYKAKQKGKVFVKIGTFFASSKTCSRLRASVADAESRNSRLDMPALRCSS